MIKNKLLILFTILSALALGACGSSSSSGGGGGGGGGGLATGGFTKTYQPDSATGGVSGPFNNQTYRRAMTIHLASDLNGSGYITAIKYRYNTTLNTGSGSSCPNTSIRLAHTGAAEFDGVDNNFASWVGSGASAGGRGSVVNSINNSTVVIPDGAAGAYHQITLNTPFYYNGVDNLVVDIERTTACTNTVSHRNETPTPYTAQLYINTQVAAGNPLTRAPQAQFVFAGGDNKVTYSTSVGNSIPFTTIAAGNHGQFLYTAAEVGGSGPITGIGLTASNTSTADEVTVTIKLAHTNLGAITDTFAANMNVGSPKTVADAITFTIPAGVPAGETIWIPVTGSFNYNGTDNLIVDIEASGVDADLFWHRGGLANRMLAAAPGLLTGVIQPSGPKHTIFRFNGGTMEVITAGTANDNYPFDDTVNPKRQYLYPGAQIGTSATITSVACRLFTAGPTVATDYANFEVVLGHTTLPALTTTFADNMDDAQTVFSGTFSMPAGLIKGDWIEIPISSFAVDPSKNLVVQMASDSGANRYDCSVATSLSPGYHAFTGTRANLIGGVNNFTADLRLGYSK